MDINHHIKIFTEGKSYEFDLVSKGGNLSSGYKIIPSKEGDLPAIRKILSSAMAESTITVDVLINRLKHLPMVSHVKASFITKTHALGIPIILGKKTTPASQTKSLDKVAKTLEKPLQTTCPQGAGSIVMISRPKEGAQCVSTGRRSVKGKELNGQTAALIGSGAKMFTSLCSMALISKGAVNEKTHPPQPLTLDTKISDILSPKQMLIFDDQAKARELTFGMLLSHTSGLVYFADDNRDEREGMSLSAILDNLKPGSVKFYGTPGDQIYSYSNHIGLAAAMLEIACEKPYAEILQDELLTPLGMDRTSYTCPSDDNVLLAYRPSSSLEKIARTEKHIARLKKQKASAKRRNKAGFASQIYAHEKRLEKLKEPVSVKMVVKDPMMQGAGGLWSCMDDMAKLGTRLGSALSKKGNLIGTNGQTVISKENLQSMIRPQAINATCGLAFDIEGDVVGKGGGIHGYDFQFKIDAKSGSCVSMMCNHAGQGDFGRYLQTTETALHELNPKISLPKTEKAPPTPKKVEELPIEECSQQFKGFSGILALPAGRPLSRINFNGTTLPVRKLPDKEIEGLTERYLIEGDSPFQGKELQIYQRNHHLYPCLSEGMEVWSFGEIGGTEFPVISPGDLSKQLKGAAGDYIDTTPGGPPPHQIRVDSERGLTLGFPGQPPSKCLITARSDNEVSFTACIGGGPQCYSYKLIKDEKAKSWNLVMLNAETESVITQLSRK